MKRRRIMKKLFSSKRFNLGKIIIALLLCLFCSFSFAGCISMNVGGSSGGSSGGGSTGGGSGDTGSGGTGGEGSGGTGSTSGSANSIKDFNDVFIGAIGVYDIEGDEEVFFDKYAATELSYNTLVNRQFDTLATYIYSSLNRIYGAPSSATNITFTGFGANKTLNYTSIITDDNQKILTGLSSGILENSEYLNYENAISGGYTIIATDNGDETYSISYDTTAIKTEYAWAGKDYFTIDKIKDALGYIYNNQKTVKNPDSEITVTSDTTLKNYYVNQFSLAAVETFDASKITSIGVSNEFAWNVAYYVAYGLIGQVNINNSIDNYGSIFSGSNIRDLSASNFSTLPEALQKYKGYNLVVADIMNKIVSLNISSSVTISAKNATWENTCFPSLKKEMYIYYDTIEDVCDANNDGAGDTGDDFDEDDYDEEAADKIDHGIARRLKKVILIPYIDTSKNNISSFPLGGALLGFQSTTGEGPFNVEVTVSGLDKDGKDVTAKSLVLSGDENVKNNKINFDDNYSLSKDLVDMSVDLGTEFGTMESSVETGNVDGGGNPIYVSLDTLIYESFTNEVITVNYENGGSKDISCGNLSVYNRLIDSEGNVCALNNVVEINFKYTTNSGTAMDIAPMIYMMYFYVF